MHEGGKGSNLKLTKGLQYRETTHQPR